MISGRFEDIEYYLAGRLEEEGYLTMKPVEMEKLAGMISHHTV